MPLVVGIAVAQTIESQTGYGARLKWPNDVWVEHHGLPRKVAGILTTSSLRGREIDHLLVGIGINVAAPAAELPPGATSILAATGVEVSVEDLLQGLLEHLEAAYLSFLEASGRPSLDGYRQRAAMLGDQVTIEQMGAQLDGRYVGVDDDGALLLEPDGGPVQRIVTGDLVRGPRPARL
jgi:BirA family biotin operon repressor/biotin-[acetyl-CoA-carboxylase] ligase